MVITLKISKGLNLDRDYMQILLKMCYNLCEKLEVYYWII